MVVQVRFFDGTGHPAGGVEFENPAGGGLLAAVAKRWHCSRSHGHGHSHGKQPLLQQKSYQQIREAVNTQQPQEQEQAHEQEGREKEEEEEEDVNSRLSGLIHSALVEKGDLNLAAALREDDVLGKRPRQVGKPPSLFSSQGQSGRQHQQQKQQKQKQKQKRHKKVPLKHKTRAVVGGGH